MTHSGLLLKACPPRIEPFGVALEGERADDREAEDHSSPDRTLW